MMGVTFWELLLLLGAGFFGGVVNSVAGGGSFITFPALLFVGVPPISANATNTFSSCAGYFSGAYAFRDDLVAHKKEIPQLILVSLLGGIIGAWLLLQTPEAVFREAIPWLLLYATVLFVFGSRLNRALRRITSTHHHASKAGAFLLLLVLLAGCIYGGFFNAGLGIITLSYLALAGHNNINAMNGMKLLVSSVVSIIAIVLFVYDDVIAWHEGGVVMVGTLLGGYVAATVSKRLAQQHIRTFVIFTSCVITGYFFYDIYGI